MFVIKFFVFEILFSVLVAIQSKINSTNLITEEDILKSLNELLFRNRLQKFSLCFPFIILKITGLNFTPKPRVDFVHVLVLIFKITHQGFSLNFKFIIWNSVNDFSLSKKKFVCLINTIFGWVLSRLYNETNAINFFISDIRWPYNIPQLLLSSKIVKIWLRNIALYQCKCQFFSIMIVIHETFVNLIIYFYSRVLVCFVDYLHFYHVITGWFDHAKFLNIGQRKRCHR